MRAVLSSGHGSALQADARRADIQGLRGIAIASVVVYHAAPRFAPGGFIGVDIFFVISGFLITGILTRALEADAFSISGFYERRIKRLFPALFAVLAAAFAAGLIMLAPRDLSELARTTLSTLFFVSNFDFLSLTGYFAGDSADKPLLHTWSLAVEEQFYIFYPLLTWLVWKTARRHTLVLVALATCAALALSVWGARREPDAAFYLVPFRAFELLMGATVAFLPAAALGKEWRSALTLLGAALFAAAIVLFHSGMHWPGLAALVPCSAAALVIYARPEATSLGGRIVATPLLTGLGAISYSLYLWHWPLLSFGRHFKGSPLSSIEAAPLVILAIVLAALSWRFIEQPALKAHWPRPALFARAGAAMAVISLIMVLVMFDRGAPQRFTPQAQALFAAADDYNHRRDVCHGDEAHQIPYEAKCAFGAPGIAPTFAVWGDSAGAELVVALGEAARARNQSVAQITYSACPPALDYRVSDRPHCLAHNAETLAALVRDARMRTIVLSANFQNVPPEARSDLYNGYRRSVEGLRAAGKTVVLAYPFPDPWIISPTVLGLRAQHHQPLDTVGIASAEYQNENRETLDFLDALSAKTGAVRFRMTDALCSGAFCPSYLPGYGVLYFDGNHISVSGARLAITHFPFDTLPPPAARTVM